MTIQARVQTFTKQTVSFHRNVYVAFTCTFFFGFLIFGGVFQVLANLFLIRLGFGPEFVGLLNGLGLLFVSVGSIIGAALGQRIGANTLMRGGYMLFFIGMVLFPLATFLPQPVQRGWLLATYSLGFLMAAIYVVHMNPLLMASTTDEERNRVFSYWAAILTIGGFIGSWFAGSVSTVFFNRFAMSVDSPVPYGWTLFLASTLAVVGVIATFFVRDPAPRQSADAKRDRTDSDQTQDPFPRGVILIVAGVIALRVVGEMAVRNFSNLYLDVDFALDPASIAYIFSITQLISIPAPLLAPWLMDRYGRGFVFNWATVGMAGCVIIVAVSPHWLWIAISYFFMLALAQIARPAITIISMSSVTPKWQSSMSSSNLVAFGLSGLVSSLMGGYMIGNFGFRPFFLLAGAITLVGVAVFWFSFLKNEGNNAV